MQNCKQNSFYSIIFLLLFVSTTSNIVAQDDLLDALDDDDKTQFELPAFKTLKIGNLQSTKVVDKGDLFLIVSHRFGPLKDGFDTFLGLDQANTKIELLYSFFKGVQFSISRESFEKTLALASKIQLVKQSNKFPVNITAYGTINRNTELNATRFDDDFTLEDADRYSYALQLLISKRFSKNFSFEIAPSYIRENLQILDETITANHNQFAMGFGGRMKLSKRISFNTEYIHNFNRDKNAIYKNSYAFGLDIETGGHVFQLLFTNGQSTNEPGFISNADGNLAFGFNVVRVF